MPVPPGTWHALDHCILPSPFSQASIDWLDLMMQTQQATPSTSLLQMTARSSVGERSTMHLPGPGPSAPSEGRDVKPPMLAAGVSFERNELMPSTSAAASGGQRAMLESGGNDSNVSQLPAVGPATSTSVPWQSSLQFLQPSALPSDPALVAYLHHQPKTTAAHENEGALGQPASFAALALARESWPGENGPLAGCAHRTPEPEDFVDKHGGRPGHASTLSHVHLRYATTSTQSETLAVPHDGAEAFQVRGKE